MPSSEVAFQLELMSQCVNLPDGLELREWSPRLQYPESEKPLLLAPLVDLSYSQIYLYQLIVLGEVCSPALHRLPHHHIVIESSGNQSALLHNILICCYCSHLLNGALLAELVQAVELGMKYISLLNLFLCIASQDPQYLLGLIQIKLMQSQSQHITFVKCILPAPKDLLLNPLDTL